MRCYQSTNARAHLVEVGTSIPADTDDLRQALKREIFSRRLTYADVAKRMELSESFVKHRLSKNTAATQIHPGFLNRLISVVAITPRVARRLHYLAAIEAGWDIGPFEAHYKRNKKAGQDIN